LSVPAPCRARSGSGRWETIRYALDSNARTFRLCLILVVATAAPCVAAVVAVVAVLIRHMLLAIGAKAVAGQVRARSARRWLRTELAIVLRAASIELSTGRMRCFGDER
jgi:hypothetical protein